MDLPRFRGATEAFVGGVHDGQDTPRIPAEFRRQVVELVRAGRNPEDLAREFEPSAQAIRNWVRQAERDGGHRVDGLATGEREELARLRREVRQLRQERDILAKAAAWFARETGTIPSGSRGGRSGRATPIVRTS